MDLGIGGEALRAPKVRNQAGKERRIHIEKTLDGTIGGKYGGEETRGIILLAWRRQPALEEAAGNFAKQCMLSGDPRFREERNRIERTERRLYPLLKAGAQVGVLLDHAQPTGQAGLVISLGTLVPDAGEKLDEAIGLAGQGGRGAESLCLTAHRGHRPSGGLGAAGARLPKTPKIGEKGHLPLNHSSNPG